VNHSNFPANLCDGGGGGGKHGVRCGLVVAHFFSTQIYTQYTHTIHTNLPHLPAEEVVHLPDLVRHLPQVAEGEPACVGCC
jgi:hypothetical protein